MRVNVLSFYVSIMWVHCTLQINSSPGLVKVFSPISGNVLEAKQTLPIVAVSTPVFFIVDQRSRTRVASKGRVSHSTELCTTCAVCSRLCSEREVCKLQMCIWKMDVLDCMHLNF